MEKLIFRKIIKDITKFFLLITFSVGLIVWIIQAVNYLDFVSEDGHNIILYVWYDNEFGYTKQVIRLAKYISEVRRLHYY